MDLAPGASPGMLGHRTNWEPPQGATDRLRRTTVAHAYATLLVHIIFATKRREPTLHDAHRVRLRQYASGVIRNEIGHCLAINGTRDHLHILVALRRAVSVAEAVRKIKSLSSRWIHETFSDSRDFAWQEGYGAFSVSPSKADAVVQYIAGQEEHHRRVGFEEEFVAFLERHGVDYDRERLWN